MPHPRRFAAFALVAALAGAMPAVADEPGPPAGKPPVPPDALSPRLLPIDREQERRGANACALGACLCGGGQCYNGDPLKGVLVAGGGAVLATTSLVFLGMLASPPSAGPRGQVMVGFALANLGGFALWAWSLADAYLTGAQVTLAPAAAPRPVIRPPEADAAR